MISIDIPDDGRASRPTSSLRFLPTTILRWLERRRQYADLAELDDNRLRDIGLTREEVCRVRGSPVRWLAGDRQGA
jgi:uncharacterized protein YjiS (DUF1127 family)